MTTEENSEKHILLVEDQDVVARTVSMALSVAGYRCEHASNGMRALSMLDEGLTPDLIILDIIMPVMDGYEFLEKFRKVTGMKDIPVIMLTSLNEPADVLKTLKAGAVDYQTKPIDVEGLLRSVERHI